MATQYQKRMAARRSTSDITRLAQQYQQEIAGVTGQYETEYAKYSQAVNEKMKPFEEEMKKYQSTVMPAYEAQMSEYKKRLEQHNLALAEIEKNPVIEKKGKETKWIPAPIADPYAIAPQYYPVEGEYTYYEPRELPKFTEKAPVAPVAPVSPASEKFDQAKFEEQRKNIEQTFKREVGERRAAKLGAVSRKATRPLLGGATP